MSLNLSLNKILIIDFGSQFTQLIARRIRELGVFSEIISHKKIKNKNINNSIKGIILSGGPLNVYEINKYSFDKKILDLGIPILGICYGQQLMMHQLGGAVERGNGTAEFGRAFLSKNGELDILSGWFKNGSEQVWMSHGDKVTQLPEGFLRTAETDSCPIAAMAHAEKPWFGIQFHPESILTPEGDRLLQNFLGIEVPNR